MRSNHLAVWTLFGAAMCVYDLNFVSISVFDYATKFYLCIIYICDTLENSQHDKKVKVLYG